MPLLLLVIGLLLFIGLVLIHEWGHYKAARKFGVEVEEFGVGFPPKLYGKKLGKHQTEYTVNLLPLGGFVRLKGEHDADTAKGTFGSARLRHKLIIMAAGVVMNLATALVLLTLLALTGLPKLIPDQFTVASDVKIVKNDILIAGVYDQTPAQQAGLRQYDRLISIRSTDSSDCANRCERVIDSEQSLRDATKAFAGQTVQVQYQRRGEDRAAIAEVKLRSEAEVAQIIEANKQAPVDQLRAPGFLGVEPYQLQVTRHTWSAPIVAVGLSKQLVQLTLGGLGSAVGSLASGDTAAASENVSGPVGIFFILKQGSNLGMAYVLTIIAIISLTLALMNVLPIPALDGGRLFVILLFHFLGKPLKERTEDLIHGAGFALMMLLFLLITVVDIRRFF